MVVFVAQKGTNLFAMVERRRPELGAGRGKQQHVVADGSCEALVSWGQGPVVLGKGGSTDASPGLGVFMGWHTLIAGCMVRLMIH